MLCPPKKSWQKYGLLFFEVSRFFFIFLISGMDLVNILEFCEIKNQNNVQGKVLFLALNKHYKPLFDPQLSLVEKNLI